jgi:amidohydrolase
VEKPVAELFKRLAPEIGDRMIACRRLLHQNPELSGREEQTAAHVAEWLRRLSIPIRTGVGGHGIVADIPGSTERGRIALRADLDALPIQEETGLPFASVHPGVMHACGHDGHTSMLLGAAELLCREPELPVSVRLIFQPAEELGVGAASMVAAGALDGVVRIFGAHVDRHYATGEIALSDSVMNASTDTFEVTITGQGGHAARPHESVDAVVVGSLMVMALQTIVSREVNPAFPSVVTVGRFVSGTAANVIAGQAKLSGTIRAQHPEVREHLKRSLRRIVDSVGSLHGATVGVEFSEGTPPVINDPASAALARQAAAQVVGTRGVVPLKSANMGGEDFSYYLEKVPGSYVRIGARCPGSENFPAHSSRFDFDEEAMLVGAAYFHAVALNAGRQLRTGSAG